MCLEEECKKNPTSPEAFGKFLFQSHLAKKLFPAISELVYVPRDGLCLITRTKFLQECQVEMGLPSHQSVPHLKSVVVNIPLVFGLQMERMYNRTPIPKSSFILKK